MAQWIRFRKWFGIVFIVILSQAQVVVADDNQVTQDSAHALVSSDEQKSTDSPFKSNPLESFLDQMSGGCDKRPVNNLDLEDLQQELLKILASHFKAQFEKRNSMFELLAHDDQQKMKEAEKSYQSIVEKIDITNILTLLCVSVQDADSQGSFAFFDEEKHTIFVDLLAKLQISLSSRTFIHLFKGLDENAREEMGMMASPDQLFNMVGQLGQQAHIRPAEPALTLDELGRFINYLDEILTNLGISQSTQTIQEMHAFLSAIYKKQSNQVTLLVLAWVNDDLNRTSELLKGAVAQFENVQTQALDQKVQEAYDFWLKTLKRFYRSLQVFESLKSDASLNSERLSHDLFAFVTYGYDIAHGFFDLYKLDNHIGKFSGPVIADWVLCSSLATWHFFNMKSNFCNDLLLKTILGETKVDAFEARQLLMFNAMLIPSVIPVLLDPSFWNKKPYGLAKIAHKAITAWLYYLVVDGDLFGENTTWWSAQGPQDRHIRKALLYALDEGVTYLSYYVERRIRYNTNPMLLEKARNYSMGIIRPAMVTYILKAVVPLIFLKNTNLGLPEIPGIDKVVQFNREDIYGKAFMSSFFNSCKIQPALQNDHPNTYGQNADECLHKKYQDDYDRWRDRQKNQGNALRTPDQIAQDYQQIYGINVDELYLASLATSYVSKSVGGFWGRKIAQNYKSQLYTMAEKTLGLLGSGLETIGLMSHDQIESIKELREDLVSEFEQELVLLKFILKSIFEEKSSFRSAIIPLLVNRGYIAQGETNPIEINRVIVYFAVDFLARQNFLNYVDAAKIVRQFAIDPYAIEVVIDKIIDGVLGGLVGTAGEYAGSTAASQIGNWAFAKYAPDLLRAARS